MRRLLLAVVLLGGCSGHPVQGTVTHKRMVHSVSYVEWRTVGGYPLPLRFTTPAKYEIGVTGRGMSGDSAARWIAVDAEEYDDTRLGDKWQDGWHVAKTHK